MHDRWVAHPNRFETPAQPRPTSMSTAPPPPISGGHHQPDMTRGCILILPLPERYRRRRTAEGNVVFSDRSWDRALASAHGLAQSLNPEAPWFGIKYPRATTFEWWDGTATTEDRLAGADAAEHIQPWLEHVFPDATGPMRIIDQRDL